MSASSALQNAALFFLASTSGLALAQSSPVDAEQGFWLQGTALAAKLKSSVRSSSTFSDLQGTTLNLESDYGLPSQRAVGSVAAGMRLGTRWRLEGEVLWIDRSGSSVTLARDLVFDDYTYRARTTVRVNFNRQDVRFGGGYSFVNSESAEVGVSFGFLASTAKTRIELAGDSVGSGSILPQITRDFTTVMPILGVYGRNSFGPGWGLAWRVEGARGVGNNDEGDAVNMSISGHWRVTPSFALHAGARYFVSRLESRNSIVLVGSLLGATTVKTSMFGPQVGVILSF
jgi:hypothetical protein